MANTEQTQSGRIGIANLGQPGVGTLAPDFCLKNPADELMVQLSAFEGRYVLLVFFRGTWCPNCRKQFHILSESQDRLQKAGMATVGVICQGPGSVQRYLKSNPLPFPLLADESRVVAKLYGVHYWLSYEGFNLANPSIFILDPNRQIMFAYRGKNQSDMPISAILEKFVSLLENKSL